MPKRFPFIAHSSNGETFQSLSFFQEHFFLFYIFALSWVIAVLVYSGFSRNRKGKPIFRPKFPNPRFNEQWLSGRSLKSFFSGRANNCLWVTITDGELWMCPHFPFNLFTSMYKKSGLEHRISGIDILSVEHPPVTSGGGRVIIRYRSATGAEEAFEITVRDVQAFDRAIGEIRNQPAPT